MEKVKRAGGWVLAILLLLVFQQAVSLIGGRAANALGLLSNDPQCPYGWIAVHHLVQMALGLLAIWLLWRTFHISFCLRPTWDRAGMGILAAFTVLVAAITAAGYRLMYPSSADIFYPYALNARNIAGVLGFQLLLSGPSEEIIFRALPIAALCAIGGQREGKAAPWLAVIAAAVLFALGHVSWYTDPFRLEFSWFQLGYSFLYGLAYGFAYLKTRSVLYPMLMHSVSNLLMVGMGYLFKLALPW